MKVLVTDADYKQGLAVIRALAIEGVEVDASAHATRALGFYSRYVKKRLIYPDPADRRSFIDAIERLDSLNNYDAILPIGSKTWFAFATVKSGIMDKIPLPPLDSYLIARHKTKTIRFARKIGIPIPDSIVAGDGASRSIEKLGLPIVVKPSLGSGSRDVSYSSSRKWALAQYRMTLEAGQIEDPLILQEFIPGTGYGYFALFNRGTLRAKFMHHRIREEPVTGGASTAAESVYDPELERLGEKTLRSLRWHGVAMVEFKKDSRDGQFKLIEINPKFWGSLDLAVASGVNFPYLACQMVTNGDVENVNSYRVGVRYVWPLPDDLARLRTTPSSLRASIVDLIKPCVRKNIWTTDLGPTLKEMARIVDTFSITRAQALQRRLCRGPRRFGWVVTGQLAASARPRSHSQLRWIRRQGIKGILSLTEEPLPGEWLDTKGGKRFPYLHMPMKDHYPPSVEQLHRACTFIDTEIRHGRAVLVHCLGGIGRTGTVIACFFMVRDGLEPEIAISRVRRMRPSSIEKLQQISINRYYSFLSNLQLSTHGQSCLGTRPLA